MVERVGRNWNFKNVIPLERQPEKVPGKHVGGAAFARIRIHARKRLAAVFVSDDLAVGIDANTTTIDGRSAFRIPTGALVAHVLDANRAPKMLRQYTRVRGCIALVVATIG